MMITNTILAIDVQKFNFVLCWLQVLSKKMDKNQ